MISVVLVEFYKYDKMVNVLIVVIYSEAKTVKVVLHGNDGVHVIGIVVVVGL